MPISLKSLKEKRVSIRDEMRRLLDKRGRKENDFTQTDKERYDALAAEAELVNSQISEIERFENLGFGEEFDNLEPKIQANLVNLSGRVNGDHTAKAFFRSSGPSFEYCEFVPQTDRERLLASDIYNKAVCSFIRNSEGNHVDYVARYLERNQCPDGANTSDFSTGGWLTTPTQMLAGILRCCDKMVKFRQFARIFTVTEACSLGVRKHLNDISNATWGSECAQPTCGMPEGHVKVLTPSVLTACTSICRELLRKTPDGTEGYFVESLSRAISYKMEEGYFYGNGNKQPLGVLTKDAIAASRYITHPNNAAFDGDKLIDMLCNIPDCFLGGNLVWFMSRAMMCAILKLKTQYGYLWSMTSDRGLAAGAPGTLLGYPFFTSEFMNAYTPGVSQAGAVGWVPLMLADLSQYWIADANQQLLEPDLCVGKDTITWYSRTWTDGMPMCDEAFTGLLIT